MGRRCGGFRDLFDGRLGQLGVSKGAAALVTHGGLDAGVTEQLLDFTYVDATLEGMDGDRVTQGPRCASGLRSMAVT